MNYENEERRIFMSNTAKGSVSQVMGPVVDVAFELLQQLTPEEREEILSKYGIQG